jgi:hypothetical protein
MSTEDSQFLYVAKSIVEASALGFTQQGRLRRFKNESKTVEVSDVNESLNRQEAQFAQKLRELAHNK